jgi:hypothetical protein
MVRAKMGSHQIAKRKNDLLLQANNILVQRGLKTHNLIIIASLEELAELRGSVPNCQVLEVLPQE